MSEPRIWKHFPWLLALVAAPLALGGRIPEAQALIAVLLGLGLICCAVVPSDSSLRPRDIAAWQWSVILLVLLAPLIPLPEWALVHLAPGRTALAREFPVDPGAQASVFSFTSSPARTVRRIWELCLILAGFVLARRAASETRFVSLLYKFLIVGLGLLCLSDLQFRLGHQKFILGIWPDRSGHGAATFVNRNHFADWVCLAVLFSAGPVVRQYSALRTARGARLERHHRLAAPWAFLGLAVIAVSIAFLLATGSRGGVIALLAGSLVWLLLLAKRGRNKARLAGIGLALFLGFAVAIFTADYLFSRWQDPSLGFKFKIWTDALRIFPAFCWLGTGWGAFETVFSLRKSFGAGLVFLHAENEYLQLLLEAGLLGALPLFFIGGRLLLRSCRRAWQDRLQEPECYFGALAALAAFLVHSLTEFVWQVPATALLAAVLLGYLSGAPTAGEQRQSLPSALPRRWFTGLFAGVFVLAVGILQGVASWQWAWGYAARDANLGLSVRLMESSLRWWPWATDRQLVAIRNEARLAVLGGELGHGETPEFLRIRGLLNRALSLEPYDWQVRFERALFDLSYGSDASRARREVLETVAINPLNARIPFQFAELCLDRDPDLAFELLRRASALSSENLKAVFELSWRAAPDASRLWDLTPETREGWLALGDFAVDHHLFPLAVEAYSKLIGLLPAAKLVDRFLMAGRPDLAVKTLGTRPGTAGESLLLCRASRALRDWPRAIRAAEAIWRSIPLPSRFTTSRYMADLTRTNLYSEIPRDAESAERLAEALRLEAVSSQESEALMRLHDLFPENARLLWLAFDASLRSREFERAAGLAEILATQVLSLYPGSAASRLPDEPPARSGQPVNR